MNHSTWTPSWLSIGFFICLLRLSDKLWSPLLRYSSMITSKSPSIILWWALFLRLGYLEPIFRFLTRVVLMLTLLCLNTELSNVLACRRIPVAQSRHAQGLPESWQLCLICDCTELSLSWRLSCILVQALGTLFARKAEVRPQALPFLGAQLLLWEDLVSQVSQGMVRHLRDTCLVSWLRDCL